MLSGVSAGFVLVWFFLLGSFGVGLGLEGCGLLVLFGFALGVISPHC